MISFGNGSTPYSGTTGRTLILVEEGATAKAGDALRDAAGISVVSSGELGDGPAALEELDAQGILFDEIGVAVVDAAPDQVDALRSSVMDDGVLVIAEEERWVYASDVAAPPAPAPLAAAGSHEYLRGLRDAANAVLSGGTIEAPAPERPPVFAAAPAVDESGATWGLQAVGALTSGFSGKGVKVAVLDTGMALSHPDFAGRNPVARSFIAGEAPEDGHGHGTHCIGTACGPRVPGRPPRYGIAFDAQIHVGKVLSNRGSGTDESILGGINWAVTSGCRVVSMSLGAQIPFGTTPSRIFEAVALRALRSGTLIVAAAGNNRNTGPVNHPANCPSIMAVGAIDSAGQVAPFSCSSDPRGGKVDIAGPGVAVYSSWPMPTRYRTISGTSMATPHVAGIAALLAEARQGRGLELWGMLTQTARPLPLPMFDVGSGLVHAP